MKSHTNQNGNRCCYADTVEQFLKEKEKPWLTEMIKNFHSVYPDLSLDNREKQIEAWNDCFRVLQKVLDTLPNPDTTWIIFEYKLPFAGERRPDVLLITPYSIYVLEFKMKGQICSSDCDQVLTYARDLNEYHKESRHLKVYPILVLTAPTTFTKQQTHPSSQLEIYYGSDWHLQLHEPENTEDSRPLIPLNTWLHSSYEPLPSIVEAAKTLFHKQPLPEIRQASSAGIPKTLSCLKEAAKIACKNKEHIVAFVTGVPGAGKTLLGLQMTYDTYIAEKSQSLFCSGNGPLISVLQYALQNEAFIKPIHNVLIDEFSNENHIVIFDEGQRAWDKKENSNAESEPYQLLTKMESSLDWSFLLVLIGEGQTIYNREKGRMQLWTNALRRCPTWKVLAPYKLNAMFSSKQLIFRTDRNYLDLTISLRTHTSSNTSLFINLVLDGQWNKAKNILRTLNDSNFKFYLTRNLDHAKNYCQRLYESNSQKHYGLLASSSKIGFYTSKGIYRVGGYSSIPKDRKSLGEWFLAPKSIPGSGKHFKRIAKEFDCQGLELDSSIVCWGQDCLWQNNHWNLQQWLYEKRLWQSLTDPASEEYAYRLNAYRVLLTRARDACILYFPQHDVFDSTFNAFKNIGVKILQEEDFSN